MIVRAWRIVRAKHLDTAFSGEGAAANGGRWNEEGTRVVYASSSLALAKLELIPTFGLLKSPDDYMAIPIEFSSTLLEVASPLPSDWLQEGYPASTQSLGSSWVRELRSVVLAVPSVYVVQEMNYLLNPSHPGFARIRIGFLEPCTWHEKLLARRIGGRRKS